MKNNERLKLVFAAAVALLSMAIANVANAIPLLEILNNATNTPGAADLHTFGDGAEEQTGDPGGSVYPYAGGPGPGAGVPWQSRDVAGNITGGWPTGAGLGADTSFPPNFGTTGWHTSYLYLSEAANVTFQFMGAGNSSQANVFEVNNVPIFIDGTTAPCAVTPAGATAPSCNPGTNERTFFFNAGLIPFEYLTGNGVLLDNTGAGLGNPDPHTTNNPGYFLGSDPYVALGTYENTNSVVYAGLSDLPAPGDHDFQDMGVRISATSVPEPGSLALLGAGLLGLAFGRKAKSPVTKAVS